MLSLQPKACGLNSGAAVECMPHRHLLSDNRRRMADAGVLALSLCLISMRRTLQNDTTCRAPALSPRAAREKPKKSFSSGGRLREMEVSCSVHSTTWKPSSARLLMAPRPSYASQRLLLSCPAMHASPVAAPPTRGACSQAAADSCGVWLRVACRSCAACLCHDLACLMRHCQCHDAHDQTLNATGTSNVFIYFSCNVLL